MILGVDHLALSVINTDKAKAELEANNFRCFFLERSVPNNPSKRILLSHYQDHHDLGLFQSRDGGICLEITNHGSVLADSEGAYLYCNDHISLRTGDVEMEKKFFKKALGFRESSESTVLQLASPVANWTCILKLIKINIISSCFLDSKGYTCLALVTNNLSKDIKVIKDAGAYDIIKPFKAFINNKILEIAMFRTPTGAICELVQIGK